jgi:hypothetical protein
MNYPTPDEMRIARGIGLGIAMLLAEVDAAEAINRMAADCLKAAIQAAEEAKRLVLLGTEAK